MSQALLDANFVGGRGSAHLTATLSESLSSGFRNQNSLLHEPFACFPKSVL